MICISELYLFMKHRANNSPFWYATAWTTCKIDSGSNNLLAQNVPDNIGKYIRPGRGLNLKLLSESHRFQFGNLCLAGHGKQKQEDSGRIQNAYLSQLLADGIITLRYCIGVYFHINQIVRKLGILKFFCT